MRREGEETHPLLGFLHWWREQGGACAVSFDTSLYARVALQHKHGYWEHGQEMPLYIERGTTLRPRWYWQQRVWEY